MIGVLHGPDGSLQLILTARKSYVLFDPETPIDSIAGALANRVDTRVLEHIKSKWKSTIERLSARGKDRIVFVGTQGVVKQRGKFQVIG